MISGEIIVPIVNVIRLSNIEGATRIDSEYYSPQFVENRKILLDNSMRLGKYCFVTDGEHGSVDFQEQGIKYIIAENVKENYVDLDGIRYVSDEVDRRNKRASLQEEDVLLSIKGTVGLSSVVTLDMLPANLNRDVARLVPNQKYIDPYFLSIFLNSKYGRLQTLRESSGNVQQMITLGRIRELLIPILKNQKLYNIIVEYSLECISRSKSLYYDAQKLLLDELGLSDFNPKYELSYVSNLMNSVNEYRMDAEYFQPAYEELIEKIKNYKYGYKKLLNLSKDIKPNFNPLSFPNNTFNYVELSNIDSSLGIITDFTTLKGDEAPSRAKRILKHEDIIVSSIEGSLDKVAIVDKYSENSIASNGFFQLRPMGILPETLLIMFKTSILQMQLKKGCSGTILTAVPTNSLKKFIIPNVKEELQKDVTLLIQKSHKERNNAKTLFEIAKKGVEIAIEKDEATSENWMKEEIKKLGIEIKFKLGGPTGGL
ncbi:MAG: EcoKI restriction-modification system protein HsdS [Candidatus Methanofastidiosum methylothiophilum]|uniref:EcoKI restriction-modification system protein HsdS n=1 Tax=Candidatus Methanofastidiosum methylothiophilum TaxID=1705564 RepID=A0A150JHH0_9EURY|nr:MAG: EcoKI restriction-modification system protein HsdS [Candidatus Methanofastidiosum methylthiophilus]OQC52065.1 MAG: EcoKI restriction-modification system protein HsdS [Euryarchaeota archaeon ADurb.Bin023]HOR88138.1 hypothetical protein [Methanofastidiosum sp.]KYC56631.1 MAG: EcoKI restriction-modification system protein HsdS [Candidatus Methanofastidiosum methylthiophilus]KYC58356.1 MAG: EcoKI restriction-modification system protein HsdS [Candidatus Methanofastidiosum methylthiophilus]